MIIEKEDIEQCKSKWGNRFYSISVEEIIELMQGKVFYLNDGEYSTFIYLDKEGNNIKEEYDDAYAITVIEELAKAYGVEVE